MNKMSLIVLAVLALLSATLAVTSSIIDTRQIHKLESRIAVLEEEAAARSEATTDKVSAQQTAASAAVQSNAKAVAKKPDIGKKFIPASEQDVMARLKNVEESVAANDTAIADTIEEYVTDVVEGRVSELEEKQKIKQKREPTFNEFAKVLNLSKKQHKVVHDEVWELQRSVREILEEPMSNGESLLDQLAQIAALEKTKHPETGKRFMEWYWRVVSEKIPGTETTYGASIQEMKNSTEQKLGKVLDKEQNEEFTSWKVDPTEIKDLEDSPWNDFNDTVTKIVEEMEKNEE